MCCKVLTIRELDKPAGTWCRHVNPSKGCGIYGSHPHVCQAFQCLWLMKPEIPQDQRPDRSKVVLVTRHDDGQDRLIAYCDPGSPLAWRREPMYGFLKKQAQATWGSNKMIFAKAGDRFWLVTPSADIDLGEVHERASFSIQAAADGKTARITKKPASPAG